MSPFSYLQHKELNDSNTVIKKNKKFEVMILRSSSKYKYSSSTNCTEAYDVTYFARYPVVLPIPRYIFIHEKARPGVVPSQRSQVVKRNDCEDCFITYKTYTTYSLTASHQHILSFEVFLLLRFAEQTRILTKITYKLYR